MYIYNNNSNSIYNYCTIVVCHTVRNNNTQRNHFPVSCNNWQQLTTILHVGYDWMCKSNLFQLLAKYLPYGRDLGLIFFTKLLPDKNRFLCSFLGDLAVKNGQKLCFVYYTICAPLNHAVVLLFTLFFLFCRISFKAIHVFSQSISQS